MQEDARGNRVTSEKKVRQLDTQLQDEQKVLVNYQQVLCCAHASNYIDAGYFYLIIFLLLAISKKLFDNFFPLLLNCYCRRTCPNAPRWRAATRE
jgi:hypothetical protein